MIVDIDNWIKTHTVGQHRADHRDLYYTRMRGSAAEGMRSLTIKRVQGNEWWEAFKTAHGKEPELPPAPLGYEVDT